MGRGASESLDGLYRRLHGTGLVRRVIELARDEDLGPAGVDATSTACDGMAARSRADLVARQGGIVAGLAVMADVIEVFAADVSLDLRARDGERVEDGHVLARLEGSTLGLLAIERTVLNIVGRLSGVATLTSRFVARVPAGSRARVYDTRKTTPGLRVLEKYAVRCGGGESHRLGLHDAVLIKDNHIAGVRPGGLGAFVERASARARRATPPPGFVEVEVDSLEQLGELLTLPPGTVDIVLLDNMEPAAMREACARRDARAPALELEASGGVSLETIGAIARTGVDRISVGKLTHSAASLDVALDFLPGGTR